VTGRNILSAAVDFFTRRVFPPIFYFCCTSCGRQVGYCPFVVICCPLSNCIANRLTFARLRYKLFQTQLPARSDCNKFNCGWTAPVTSRTGAGQSHYPGLWRVTPLSIHLYLQTIVLSSSAYSLAEATKLWSSFFQKIKLRYSPYLVKICTVPLRS